jgi:glycosyltransferase involved in cell wall biosynthesis
MNTVLLVNTLYAPLRLGGAEHSVRLLAEALPALGWKPVVATLHQGELPECEELAGVRVRRLRLRNLFWNFPAQRPAWLKMIWHLRDSSNQAMAAAVLRIARDENAALIHTNSLWGFSAAVLPAARAAGLPTVHTLRDTHLLCPGKAMRGDQPCERSCLTCRMVTAPRRHAALSADRVVGISRYLIERHQREIAWDPTATRIIPNQIEPGSPIAACPSPRAFGYLGRVARFKGVELLLETLVDLPGDWTLDIAGAGEPDYVADLQRRFPDQRIRWLGHVDPARILARISWLIVPSLWPEGFGRVVIEALPYGVPSIVARRGGLPELVEEGISGLVFDPAAAGGLRAALSRAIADGVASEKMRAACRERAGLYNSSTVAAAYARVYAELAG